MRLSLYTGLLSGLNGKYNSEIECVERLTRAGFRYFSFGASYMIGNGLTYHDDWESKAYELRNQTEKRGGAFLQVHAPFTFSEIKSNSYYAEMTRRTFHTAKILGVEQIVIHGYFKPDWTIPYDREKDFRRCLDFYLPFVDLANRLGIGIAVENFCDVRNRDIFTTQVEEQIDFIKKLNAPHVTACLDVGHSYGIHGEKFLDKIRQLGGLISCTHIHDTFYDRDCHLPPFMGEINWQELMGTLRDIGYRGDVNYELRKCQMPENLLDAYLAYLYQAGQCLIEMAKKPPVPTNATQEIENGTL